MRKRIGFSLVMMFLLSSLFVYGQGGHSDAVLVCNVSGDQAFAQVEYNYGSDTYLIAWEDAREGYPNVNIYGQLVNGDGTLKGDNFAICESEGPQYWPHIGVDPVRNQFLVVFEDQRNGGQNGDVRGVFVDSDGNFVDAPTSIADHTFGIATNDKHIYTCSVAYNYVEQVYLVVWGDNRNNTEFYYGGVDVYGQLISGDGTLIGPPDPADPAVNFPIDIADWYIASVADVTYNDITNEFFVVYGTSIGYVLGQRVDHSGQLINPDGTVAGLAKPGRTSSVLPAMLLTVHYDNGPDCFQSCVTSRTEYSGMHVAKTSAAVYTEVLPVWKSMNENTLPNYFNDIYAQRIGFVRVVDKYIATYVDLNGDTSSNISNFPISLQPNGVDVPNLAYGAQDDEYLVSWGDPRRGPTQSDLYSQRLGINAEQKMIFLDDDQINTISETQNIAVDTSDAFEGSILGVGHNPKMNNFLVAFVYSDYTGETGADIYIHCFYGSEPTEVETRNVAVEDFRLFQNYPNPFNPSTMIAFELNSTSHIQVQVIDLNGKVVAILKDQVMSAGNHQVQWNGKNNSGLDASSGVYLYQIKADHQVASAKMMLIR